jgi:hypothetical protein
MNPIACISPHRNTLCAVLILSFHLCLCLPTDSFLQAFRLIFCIIMLTSHRSHSCFLPRPLIILCNTTVITIIIIIIIIIMNLPNFSVEWLALLRVREVPGSNIGSDTGYPDRCFSLFSSVLQVKRWDSSPWYIKLGHCSFLPHSS